MATTAPPPPLLSTPTVRELKTPRWLDRVPRGLIVGGLLLLLIAISAFIRTRYIAGAKGQFWMDEAITTGISSHPLSAIPGVLRHDGSPPLLYLVMHMWISVFGNSEAATHALPLLFALLTIPIGMWAGWSLFGRRAGIYAAILFAFSAFLSTYAQEARMYSLMGLLGLLATAGFLHGFLYRRRRYLILFSLSLTAMLYTHGWGLFFGAGTVLALIPVWLRTEDRRALVRDAMLAYGGAGILFLPWLPTFIYQAAHTGNPWAPPPRFGAPVLLSRDLIGGDRITAALVIAGVIGFAQLFTRAYRRTADATLLFTLIALPTITLLLAWLASQITPAFVARYFAPVLAAILLLAAWGCARAGIVGLVAIGLSVAFIANLSSYAPSYKSDMRDVAGEMAPYLHRGDLVISGQPEQVPLAYYYLPAGLRYATPTGMVSDPSYMDWVDALTRLQQAQASHTLIPLLASLRVGQQVLFMRPLTEGVKNWKAPWTQLVRRRSAQWGAILLADRSFRAVWVAPHNYRGACCVGDSAVLYQKVS
jgi:uncharacterized membrane protein